MYHDQAEIDRSNRNRTGDPCNRSVDPGEVERSISGEDRSIRRVWIGRSEVSIARFDFT